MDLKGLSVVITGGSSGLGFSTAKKFLEKGCRVYILGRHKENLDQAAASLNNKNLHTILADVTDYKAVKESLGNLDVDVLVNNAGIWLEGKLETYTKDKIDACIDINLKGTIYVTQAVLPGMMQKNKGFIVNVSSTSGLKGRLDQSVYVASKYGVRGFTESLEEDLMNTKIKVAGFYPGGMNTNLFAKAGMPRDNASWMNTDKVAEIIVFMVEHSDNMRINHVEVNKR